MQLSNLLTAKGLTYGPVYASGILKGHEAAKLVADFKAQETIGPMTSRILEATDADSPGIARLVDRLATFYHSDYVASNQPWVLETPFEQWRDRQLMKRGIRI